jgi:hypothetical protein
MSARCAERPDTASLDGEKAMMDLLHTILKEEEEEEERNTRACANLEPSQSLDRFPPPFGIIRADIVMQGQRIS